MHAPGRPRFDVPGLSTYFGSKGSQGTFQRIINAMPPHAVYIEPFLGSGRILRTKAPASVGNYGIELDEDVYRLWVPVIAPGVRIVWGNALQVLPVMVAQHIAAGVPPASILVYCDPPYRIDSRRAQVPTYPHEFSEEDHTAFLAMVHALPCRVMVSHLPCEQYATALRAWHTFTFNNTTRHGLQLEQLWCNFQPTAELHEYTYIGSNFRQRERFKRQFEIVTRRYDALPPAARIALLALLEARGTGDA